MSNIEINNSLSSQENNVERTYRNEEDHLNRRKIHSLLKEHTTSLGKTSEAIDNPYCYDLPNYYRWIALASCIIVCIFTGPAFMNWPPFDQIFHWANAYSHLCSATNSQYLNDGEISCDEKERAISSMFPAVTSVMFGIDLIAGILLDCSGGKICTVVGLACQILGWMLIGISGSRFNGYMAGLLLIGIGVDPAFFGLMSVSNLFPGWNSTIMAILGTARSLSFVNGIVMNRIWAYNRDSISLRTMSFIFAGILGLCFFLSVLCIPFQTYPKLPLSYKLNSETCQGKPSYKERIRRKPKADFHLFMSEGKSQINGFLHHSLTIPYLAFSMLPVITFIRLSYYSISFKKHLPTATGIYFDCDRDGAERFTFFGFYVILSPLSVIPCPFLGIFADRVSTALTILFLAICGGLSFYVYANYCFVQEHVGKLVGFSLLVGGLSSLVATPMFSFSIRTNNYLPMDLLVVSLNAVAIMICVYLYIVVEKPIRQQAICKKVSTTVTVKSEDSKNPVTV